MLEVNNLSFSYQTIPVLKDVTFKACKGDLLCILGPNGVGKSTLFKCILGLLKGYKGTIKVHDKDIKKMKCDELAKYVAYIPQSHNPVFNYCVLDIVLMGTTLHMAKFSSPKIEQEQKALYVLKSLGIEHLKDRGYSHISGGERQLVLIARAIVQEAKILVMDEPTANLDYGNQVRVMKQISDLSKKGYIIILSTHNPEHAFLYANKVLILQNGKVKIVGEPTKILDENILQQLYGVEVEIFNLKAKYGSIKVCVPSIVEPQIENKLAI